MSSRDPRARKTRLAVVGATYAFVENRKKIEAMAEYFDIVCVTSESYTCYGLENRVADQPRPTAFELVSLPSVGDPGSTTRYTLRGLGKALRAARPDIVLVESEPWAFLRWQTWWHARCLSHKVCFGEFSWENIRRPGLKGAVLGIIYRAAVATADFVIGGNDDAGALYAEAGLPTVRLLVAPQLGMDTEVFHPVGVELKAARRRELGLPATSCIIGFSGRLVEMKGVLDLIAAVERMRARPGGEEVELALLGPGDLSTLLGKRAQPEWLHTLPACTHSAMAHFMQALDIYVLPSREWNRDGIQWREQFGHVLIEAMACGIPTLGSSSGAIPSVLGNPAQIFPEGNIDQLSEMLSHFVASTAERQVVVQRQLQRLHANYTHKMLARRWAEFLERVKDMRFPRGR